MASGGAKANWATWCTKPGVMTTKDLKKLCEDCGFYKKYKFTSNDSDIAFSKFKKGTGVDYAGFESVIAQVAKERKFDKDEAMATVASTEKKSAQKATSKTGGVDRLTDASKYTGAHKERFDESGKGKGMDGRADRASGDGYVGNYKGKDSYDKAH